MSTWAIQAHDTPEGVRAWCLDQIQREYNSDNFQYIAVLNLIIKVTAFHVEAGTKYLQIDGKGSSSSGDGYGDMFLDFRCVDTEPESEPLDSDGEPESDTVESEGQEEELGAAVVPPASS